MSPKTALRSGLVSGCLRVRMASGVISAYASSGGVFDKAGGTAAWAVCAAGEADGDRLHSTAKYASRLATDLAIHTVLIIHE